MIIVGLTGSIGMGKTTTARLFAEEGVPVIDADAIVHELYSGDAVRAIEDAFPGTAVSGSVDRNALSARVLSDPNALRRLEQIVHPMVRARERAFVEKCARAGSDIAVIDIPLLFETGATDRVDRIVVASTDATVQKQRVLSRPGMTEEKFAAILARQVPDAEKRAAADYVVETGGGIEDARGQVREIIEDLRAVAHSTGN